LAVKVHPRSSKERISVADDGTVHIWVAAPAVNGAANRAVIRFLAQALKLAPSQITIKSGQSSRSKRLHVHLEETEARRLLQALGQT
jgi:uncharacterized protein (TIGR00251 family)